MRCSFLAGCNSENSCKPNSRLLDLTFAAMRRKERDRRLGFLLAWLPFDLCVLPSCVSSSSSLSLQVPGPGASNTINHLLICVSGEEQHKQKISESFLAGCTN